MNRKPELFHIDNTQLFLFHTHNHGEGVGGLGGGGGVVGAGGRLLLITC